MLYELMLDETKEEWEYAEQQAQIITEQYRQAGITLTNDSVIKIRRKDHKPQLNHSFYIVGDKLYCGDSTDGLEPNSGLTEEVYLSGTFSKVKFAKSKDGHFVRLRLVHFPYSWFEPTNIMHFRPRYGTELEILGVRGDLIGYGMRTFNKPVPFFKKALLKKYGDQKRPESYTRFKLITIIEDAGNSLDYARINMNANQRKLTTVLTCKEIQRIHRYGVIHRDIKPENIGVMISNTDPLDICVRAFDFTDSRVLSPNQVQGQSHSFEGTPGFLSYEIINSLQNSQPAHYSYRSDLIALGVSLMEVAIGDELNSMRQMIHASFVPAYVQFNLYSTYKESDITKELPQIIHDLRKDLSDDLWNRTCNNPKYYLNKPVNYLIDTLIDVIDIARCEGYAHAEIMIKITDCIRGMNASTYNESFLRLNQFLDGMRSQQDAQTKTVLFTMVREFSRDRNLYANRNAADINSTEIVDALNARLHQIKNYFDVETAKRASAAIGLLNNNNSSNNTNNNTNNNSNNNQPAKPDAGSSSQAGQVNSTPDNVRQTSQSRAYEHDDDDDNNSSNSANNNKRSNKRLKLNK